VSRTGLLTGVSTPSLSRRALRVTIRCGGCGCTGAGLGAGSPIACRKPACSKLTRWPSSKGRICVGCTCVGGVCGRCANSCCKNSNSGSSTSSSGLSPPVNTSLASLCASDLAASLSRSSSSGVGRLPPITPCGVSWKFCDKSSRARSLLNAVITSEFP